eukprot:XP_004916845.1 PREDICTED: tumor necrosis factor ligand superfamily member 10-like isoform X2 [Xenopus tropicalis]
MSCPAPQQYYRTKSRESAASMLPKADGEESSSEAGGKRQKNREGSSLWLAVGIIFILALQIACTTGLFVYFSVSISKVTENILQRTAVKEARRSIINISEAQPHRGEYMKSSAHLILNQGSPLGKGPSEDLVSGNSFQSCRYPIRQWQLRNALSHMQNMTYHDGHIKILQDGLYYIYSQIYFRYTKQKDSRPSLGHQLVQCINKKTSYVNPILLLKGVGTKCWAPNAEYGLHSVHQGGIFELRSGDELFVSVSSLDMVYADSTSNFFGAFKLSL